MAITKTIVATEAHMIAKYDLYYSEEPLPFDDEDSADLLNVRDRYCMTPAEEAVLEARSADR